METRIVHQAGIRLGTLPQRIGAVMEQAAPLVEEVTGLRLPDTLVIRTMTWRKWRRAHNRYARRALRAEVHELRPPVSSIRRAALEAKATRSLLRTSWVGVSAQVVDFRGRPEIVVLPQALREAGRLDDDTVLLQVLTHELTHVAQWESDEGTAWCLMNTRFPAERGITGLDYTFLLEGHAYWVDAQVTTKILGAPAPISDINPHGTLRYRDLAESPERAVRLRHFETARDSVATFIGTHGLDRFNEVWKNRELVPLRSETSTADTWMQRLTDREAEPAHG